jgi:hypothetical protein
MNRMQYVNEGGTNNLLAQYSWDGLSRAQSIAYGDGTSDAYSQYDAGDNLQTLTQTYNGSKLLAVFAAFEREILGECVRAPLAHARQNGKRLGRPAIAAMRTDKERKLSCSGLSKSEIGRHLNIGRTSVHASSPLKPRRNRADFSFTLLCRKHTLLRAHNCGGCTCI